jgi:uncharacterized repeat protein (TIGR01451 family)
MTHTALRSPGKGFGLLLSLFMLLCLVCTTADAQTCSIPGQAGTSTTIAAQPNTFFPGTAGVAAGATSLTVGAGTGVNRAIAPGDLLLIIQMQGADFDADNDNGYGDGTVHAGVTQTVAFGTNGYAGGSTGTNFYAGTYEWAVAANTVAYAGAGKTLQLSAPLANSYFNQAGGSGATAFKRSFQVVRVPQYARATVSADLTVQGWDGSTGGILALDVAGDLTLTGRTITGDGRGFRGGGSVNGTPHNTTCTTNWDPPPAACQHYRQPIELPGANGTVGYWGGSKGEGIAGTPGRLYSHYNTTHVAGGNGTDGYPNGDMGRGAPGNAGGGGNAHNAGGGGGGNGGAGGKGGNSWNSSTAGNVGHRIGGFGGAPSWTAVGGVTVNRLFMGGGGGAGDLGGNANAVPNGSGGAGGALVILHASRIVGGASTNINVNGEAGRSVAAAETDGTGAGGAGGTVVLKANSLSGALTVNANGGAGGAYTAAVAEQDGAGGGGGGGMLITNLAGVTFNAAGGAAGTSASTNCAPAVPAADCGQRAGSASPGSSGYAVFAPGVRTGYECLPNLTVTKSTTTPTVSNATSATAQYLINISNSGGGARFVDVMDWTLPPGWSRAATAPTYQYSPSTGLAAGAETIARTTSSTWAVGATPLSVPASGSNTLTWSSFAIPPIRDGVNSSVTITFVATIPDTATAGSYHNPAAVRFLDSTRAAASSPTVAPATGNSSNRGSVSYGNTVYSQYNGAASTNVAGSHHSGLEGGPASDDVALLPNLQVLKSTSGPTATAGSTFNYVLTVQNIGRAVDTQVYATTQATSAAATAIGSNPLRITDTLPTGYTVTAITATPTAWVCGTATGVMTCAASNPSAAAVYPIARGTTTAPVSVGAVTVTVLPRPDNCGVSGDTNTVTLVVATIGETSTADNTATASHARQCVANLQISKNNGTATLVSGATTAYTVTVSNLGPSPGDGSMVTDTPSAGLSGCSVTACSASGSAVCPAAGLWPQMIAPNPGMTLPTLPSGGAVDITVQCTVTATGT